MTPEHRTIDQLLRPGSWSEYVNQERAKRIARRAVESARNRGQLLDHVLIYGPSGLGKSTLASLIAGPEDMETLYGQTAMKDLERLDRTSADDSGLWFYQKIAANWGLKEMPEWATTPSPRHRDERLSTIHWIFIDEIHTMGIEDQESLLLKMEDPQRAITIIGATTRPDLLVTPLYNRFLIHLRLGFYQPPDMEKIVRQSAGKLELVLSDEAIRVLAGRGRGVPREANTLVRRVRDYGENLSKKDVLEALRELGIDHLGLNMAERLCVMAIHGQYGGGPVALNTLAAALSEEPQSLRLIEAFPLREGLIAITGRGRTLTRRGTEYAERIMREWSS